MCVYKVKTLWKDSSVNCAVNSFDCDIGPNLFSVFTPLCYVPAPHNTLIIHNTSELRAISLQDQNQVWSQNLDLITCSSAQSRQKILCGLTDESKHLAYRHILKTVVKVV